jgi:lysophospholipase L1-like esterase
MERSRPPSELERLIRYCHPVKILGTTRLPGVDALDDRALAALYGVSRERYRRVAADLRREARHAADEIGGRPRLPLEGRVLALGDSHTDDLASWAEILATLLRPPVINAGLSGDTTTAALARLHRLPAAAHAFVLLGTNDARRHGEQDMLVSHPETRRNIRAIDRELRRRCRHVTWITPPPVHEARMRDDPALVDAGISWRLEDVAAKAALVREEAPAALDLWPAFGARHLAADGVHPSPAGQQVIAETVLASFGSD